MQFTTQVSGFSFVCIKEYEEALHKLKQISILIQPVRATLIHDIQILENKDKNTFAKTIRVLDKLNKEIEQVVEAKL